MWEHCMGVFVCLGAAYGLCVPVHTCPRADYVCVHAHAEWVLCSSMWVCFLVLNAPRVKDVCVYAVYVCAGTCMQDIGCVCTCMCMYLIAACRQAKGCVCMLCVHTCT